MNEIASPHEVLEVRVADVVVPERRRQIRGDDPALDALVESIRDLGLITPIVVQHDLTLTAGRRRLEAHRRLGLETVRAFVRELDDVDAELVEIDENLARVELTVLERAEQMERRRQLYEVRREQARAAGLRMPGFAADAAEHLGVSRRTVERDLQIARDVDPDVAADLHGTPLADNRGELLALAALPADEQRSAVDRVLAGEAETVRPSSRWGAGDTDQGDTDQGDTDQGDTDQGDTDQGDTDQGRRWSVLFADPFWPAVDSTDFSRLAATAERNAVAFLVVSAGRLGEGLAALEAMGFAAVEAVSIVADGWHWEPGEVAAGSGMLLIGVRGVPPGPTRQIPGVLHGVENAPGEVAAEAVSAAYPDAAKVDLFGLDPPAGWDAISSAQAAAAVL